MAVTFLQVVKYIETLDNIGKGILIEYIKEHQTLTGILKEQERSSNNLKVLMISLMKGEDQT